MAKLNPADDAPFGTRAEPERHNRADYWGDDWVAVPTGQYGLLHAHDGPVDVIEVYLPLLTKEVACYCWATPPGVDPPAGGCRARSLAGAAMNDVGAWASDRHMHMRRWCGAGNHPHAYLEKMLEQGANGITWELGEYLRGVMLNDLP